MENFIHMKNRINLQTIGTCIRDDGSKTQISFANFEKRENIAFSKLEQQIIEICGTEKKNEISNAYIISLKKSILDSELTIVPPSPSAVKSALILYHKTFSEHE